MAMMSIADHDVVDVEDDDSKGGDVDDLDGDCSAWRLSVPYHLSILIRASSFSRLTATQSSVNSPIK